MVKKEWYKRIELLSLILSIIAIIVSGISAYFSYQLNKDDFVCSNVEARLQRAEKFIKEEQKKCDLQVINYNKAILRNATREFIAGDCGMARESLEKLDLRECEKKHMVVYLGFFALIAIIIFILFLLITLLIQKDKFVFKKPDLYEFREKVTYPKKEGMDKRIGNYSFIVGVIIAVVLGLAAPKLGVAAAWLWSLLVVLGLVVGFLNVSGKETKEFLLVTVSLVIVAFAGSAQINSWSNVQLIGTYLKGIFDSILAFVIPASLIVGTKFILRLAKIG